MQTQSVTAMRICFRVHFGIRLAPATNITYRLMHRFEEWSSVLERKCHSISTIWSLENVQASRVAIQHSPSKSTRMGKLGISHHSVQWILQSHLHFLLIKLQYCINLLNETRNRDCNWATSEEVVVKKKSTWFSDKDHFHFDGIINKQNIQFWAAEYPHQIQEKETDT
jgi:hypothetical protein